MNTPTKEIVISRDTLSITLLIVAVVIFGLIGFVVSPRDDTRRPVLLMPDVREVEQYRRTAKTWSDEWRGLDVQLHQMLEVKSDVDLLGSSRRSQQTFERALDLSQQVDSTDVPPALVGLHAQVRACAGGYLDASIAAARWLSAPTAENKQNAQARLETATRALGELLRNDWMRKDK